MDGTLSRGNSEGGIMEEREKESEIMDVEEFYQVPEKNWDDKFLERAFKTLRSVLPCNNCRAASLICVGKSAGRRRVECNDCKKTCYLDSAVTFFA